MNILQIVSSARTSGAEKHVLLLSEGLAQRGHNIVTVCPPGDWLPGRLQAAGVQAVELPMRGAASLGTILAVRRLAVRQGIQVIHTHLTRATYLGYFAGILSRVPVISSVHVLNPDFA